MKSTTFYILSCGWALALSTMSSQSIAKDFYKWVDANGSTHYTTTPPPKNAKNQGKLQTHDWNNSAPYQPKTDAPTPAQAPSNNQNTPTNQPKTSEQPLQQQPGEQLVASPEPKQA